MVTPSETMKLFIVEAHGLVMVVRAVTLDHAATILAAEFNEPKQYYLTRLMELQVSGEAKIIYDLTM